MPGHVFNVPQPYRHTEEQHVEKRSKFRWFGHSVRLGGSNAKSSSLTPASSSTASRRTKSSYVANDESPITSPRAASFSSATPFKLKSLGDDRDDPISSTSLLKFGLLRRNLTSPRNWNSNNSLRSSTASTASSSTFLSDDLSPPSSIRSSQSSAEEELRSPRMQHATRELLRDVVGVYATWTDDAHVACHFADLNWRVVRIQADGNCLFRAVSDQIYRNEAFYGDIRRRVVEYISREKDLFKPFVEDEQQGVHEPIREYCSRMKQDAQWGGNPELYAVARLFNVHIVVHQGPMRRLRIENDSGKPPAMELNLLFRNDHYDSLHDETQVDAMPRLSTTVVLPDEVVEDEAELQQQEAVEPATVDKKTKKPKKRVVFIGEQTRVERIEVEPVQVSVRAPTRFVVRRGRVWKPEEVPYEEYGDNQENESPQAQSTCISDEIPASQPSPVTNQRDKDLPVARVKRFNFSRGRRVAA